VRLSGARITGLLDLSFAEVGHAVLLRDCYWDVEPRLSGAQLRLVRLSGSCLPGLRVADAQIDGLLLLDRCHFDGEVTLTGTRVNGILSLHGAQLRGNPALSAVSLAVERPDLYRHGGQRRMHAAGRTGRREAGAGWRAARAPFGAQHTPATAWRKLTQRDSRRWLHG